MGGTVSHRGEGAREKAPKLGCMWWSWRWHVGSKSLFVGECILRVLSTYIHTRCILLTIYGAGVAEAKARG
jgi:hypothetical protein